MIITETRQKTWSARCSKKLVGEELSELEAMGEFDKLLNTTAQDIIESQWESEQAQSSKRMAQFFESASDQEIMNATKAFIQNANRRRPLEMSDEFYQG